jgi:hypothetical protein
MSPTTDSIPRITLGDLFFALKVIAKDSPTTLESLRQHFCIQRKLRIAGDRLWWTAMANAQELNRLGLLDLGALPKSKARFEHLKNRPVAVTQAGAQLSSQLSENRSDAYDQLFQLMFRSHPYLRAFVRAIHETHLVAPIVTSLKDHISQKYASASSLVEDISRGYIDRSAFLQNLERRLKRPLNLQEQSEITSNLKSLLDEVTSQATREEPTEFAKKFLPKLNECVLSAIFKNEGLSFDYNTHRTLWSFGQEWKLWQSTSDHPDYDGRLIFKTATVQISAPGDSIEGLIFNSGLNRTGENFLNKLYNAYIKL